MTRVSQANYEAGKRPCNIDYLANLGTNGVDIGYIITGQPSATMMSDDVADYAALSPRLANDQKAALLLLAGAIAERGGGQARPVMPQPTALPPVEALERGYLGILAASRNMDEAALARELAVRLPMLLDVLKGPVTIERDGDETVEVPPTAHPERQRA